MGLSIPRVALNIIMRPSYMVIGIACITVAASVMLMTFRLRTPGYQLESLLSEIRMEAESHPREGCTLRLELPRVLWNRMYVFTPYSDPEDIEMVGDWGEFGRFESSCTSDDKYCCLVFCDGENVAFAHDVDRRLVDFSECGVPLGGIAKEKAVFTIALQRESAEFVRASATIK
jgi:hypothetical protein